MKKEASGAAIEPPTTEQIEEWATEGVAEATDGCQVDLDGVCEHGKQSWLVELGFI